MSQQLLDLLVPVAGAAFAILFIAFIFIKSFNDDKKEKAALTEIFRKYGVKTNAKILKFKENKTYGRWIQGKYNFYIEFEYNSPERGTLSCNYILPTNDPKSKNYLNSKEIPVIYIPAYLDYHNEFIDRKEFFAAIAHKLKLGYDCWLVIFADDIKLFTNLTEF